MGQVPRPRHHPGWSGVAGQVSNPYALDHSPAGSSSGSAVAVSAALAAASVGTETGGSIVIPSGTNGVVGIKPTLGLVSRTGVIPLAESIDTAGPMARTVADVAALLEGMVGFDAKGSATLGAKGRATDYTAGLQAGALQGVRIGVMKEDLGSNGTEIVAAYDKGLDALRAAGAVLVQVEAPDLSEWRKYLGKVFEVEFKDGVDRYIKASASAMNSLADVFAYNIENPDTYGRRSHESSQAALPVTEPDFVELRTQVLALAKEQMEGTLKMNKVKALVTITNTVAWPINGKPATTIPVFPASASAARTPSISVPLGCVEGGLPLGMTFMGPAWSEKALIGYAYGFEQATKARYSPQFKPTVTSSASCV